MTDRLSLTSRFIGQYGFERLPAAVLFSFGGVPYGRAFDSAVISGDSGIATVNELSLGNVIQHKSIRGSSAFAFIDYGATWDHNSDFENSDESLGSTGVGLRLRFSTGISAEATVSVPIKSISDIADPGVTGFFSLGMSF